jgi:hypothetical protein
MRSQLSQFSFFEPQLAAEVYMPIRRRDFTNFWKMPYFSGEIKPYFSMDSQDFINYRKATRI